MEFHYIRYFLALCEQRSFIGAARQCGVSQPTVSIAIKRFEQQIGGALFLRNQPKYSECTPTELAFAIKPHLESILANLRHAQDVCRARFGKEGSQLTDLPGFVTSGPDAQQVPDRHWA